MTKQISFVVMLILAGTSVIAACSGDGSAFSRDSDPEQVVEGYIAAYNAQDIDRVMAFFAQDALFINGKERFEGAEAIRAEELLKFSVHAPGGEAYSISNLVVADNAVTWDHVFRGSAHTCVGTGNEVVVEDGKIVMFTFASAVCD